MNAKRLTAMLLSALLVFSMAGCGSKEEVVDNAPAGIAVQVETVGTDTISTENKVSGQVAADNTSTIMLSSPAKCHAVYFQAGDMVEGSAVDENSGDMSSVPGSGIFHMPWSN